jgi:hypothetical protein
MRQKTNVELMRKISAAHRRAAQYDLTPAVPTRTFNSCSGIGPRNCARIAGKSRLGCCDRRRGARPSAMVGRCPALLFRSIPSLHLGNHMVITSVWRHRIQWLPVNSLLNQSAMGGEQKYLNSPFHIVTKSSIIRRGKPFPNIAFRDRT